jgi:hypothetical protein
MDPNDRYELLCAVPESTGISIDSGADALAQQKNLRSETKGLFARAACQLRTGDALGEPEIVLDARAGTGLPAHRQRSITSVFRPSDAP